MIFPEGGNFTPERRERAIKRLDKLGLHGMATRAEEMINVLAPRPGGVLAALDAAPETDVLLVAHTGLDHVRHHRRRLALPADGQAAADGLVADPARGDPAGQDARIEWLYEWWRHVDQWIDEHRPVDLPPRQRHMKNDPPHPEVDGPSRSSRGSRAAGSGLLGLGVLHVGDVDVLGGSVRRGHRVRLLRGVGQRLARVGARRVAGRRWRTRRQRRRRRGCRPSVRKGSAGPGARPEPASGRTTSASWPTRRHPGASWPRRHRCRRGRRRGRTCASCRPSSSPAHP